jgi:hypothetical protein
MNTLVRRTRIIDRDQVIAGIAQVRQDWDQPENGNLIRVRGSVGLLLADIVAAVGLLPEEQAQALGPDLYKKIGEYCQ